MNVIIEKVNTKDAAAMIEYLKQIGAETDNLTFGSEGLSITLEAEKMYIKEIEESSSDVMFVAKVDGKIVGDASLNRLPRRMNHRGDFGIAVVKEYWNQGIGSRLLKKILNFAKYNEFKIIDLQVRSDNLSAIHLYEKYGFKKIGTHPAFFEIDNKYVSFDYMYLEL